MITVPIIKKWRLLQASKFVSFRGWTLITRKMVERKVFLANPKLEYRVSQWGAHDCSAQSQKKWRLLWESKFDSFRGYTSIIRKMEEWKLFLPNQRANIVYRNEENMIVLPIRKRINANLRMKTQPKTRLDEIVTLGSSSKSSKENLTPIKPAD